MRIKWVILLACFLPETGSAKGKETDDRLKEFETKAYELRTDLVHNHTYELANLPKADSLYRESDRMGSILGKLYALQIRTYALAGSDRKDEFFSTVDDYTRMALENGMYDEYFEGVSAKVQYLMGIGEYTKSLFESKDMVKVAEEEQSLTGIYESHMLMGQIYKYRSSWMLAEKHLLRSLEAVEKMGDEDSIPRCLLFRELAECYSSARKYAMAREYAVKAIDWANYDIYRCFSEWTFLSVLFNAERLEEFREAYAESHLHEPHYYELLPEDMKGNLDFMVAVSRGRFEEARRIEKVREEKGLPSNYMLSSLYLHEGDYRKAYEYYVQELMRMDSVESLMQQDELSEMEARLGTAQLRIEAEQAKMEHRKTLVIFSSVLIIMGFCALSYILYRRIQHTRSLLAANQATERKNAELLEANRATQEALEKAEHANAMRIRFIENMMHEIRTPLNAISGFTQVLTDPSMPLDEESGREIRDIIMSNTDNLTQMLDNIIHLSSLDSGSEEVVLEETHAGDIVSRAIEQSGSPAEGVEMEVNVADVTLNTDVKLAAETLSMLLSNAVKFTREGRICVDCQTGEDGMVRFSVTDTGIGVPADQAEKIFDRFHKLDEFVPGTGLGLSLCRALVTALGGKVFMDTTYDEGGCRFVMNLPA